MKFASSQFSFTPLHYHSFMQWSRHELAAPIRQTCKSQTSCRQHFIFPLVYYFTMQITLHSCAKPSIGSFIIPSSESKRRVCVIMGPVCHQLHSGNCTLEGCGCLCVTLCMWRKFASNNNFLSVSIQQYNINKYII